MTRHYRSARLLGNRTVPVGATVIIRRTRSPEIRWGRDPPNDGTANGSAGVNSAPDLGGQRCGNHEDRGESTDDRKPNEHLNRPLGRTLPGGLTDRSALKNCAIGQSKFQLNLLAFLVRDCLTSVLGSLATHLEPILFKLLTAISSAWCRSVAVNEPPAPRRATS
jgi:hypothetical protein